MPRVSEVLRPYVTASIKGICRAEAAEKLNGVLIFGFSYEGLHYNALVATNTHDEVAAWKLHSVKINYTAHHVPYIAIQARLDPLSRYNTCFKFYLHDFTPDDTSLYNDLEEYLNEFVLI